MELPKLSPNEYNHAEETYAKVINSGSGVAMSTLRDLIHEVERWKKYAAMRGQPTGAEFGSLLQELRQEHNFVLCLDCDHMHNSLGCTVAPKIPDLVGWWC